MVETVGKDVMGVTVREREECKERRFPFSFQLGRVAMVLTVDKSKVAERNASVRHVCSFFGEHVAWYVPAFQLNDLQID